MEVERSGRKWKLRVKVQCIVKNIKNDQHRLSHAKEGKILGILHVPKPNKRKALKVKKCEAIFLIKVSGVPKLASSSSVGRISMLCMKSA